MMSSVLVSIATVITIIIAWVVLSICAVAKQADEDATGTEAPLTNEQVRQIPTRKRGV